MKFFSKRYFASIPRNKSLIRIQLYQSSNYQIISKMLILLLFAIFSLFTVGVRSTVPDNMISGTQQLVNNFYPNSKSNSTFNIIFFNRPIHPNTYQHATTVQYISNYIMNNTMKYSLKCNEGPGVLSCTFITDAQAKWYTATIVYLISLRQDFYCGQFSQTLQAPFFDPQPVFLIQPWTYSNDPSIMTFIPFISGVDTLDTSFGFSFTNTEFFMTYQSLLFDVVVTNFSSSNNLLKIQVNYVLFQTAGVDYTVQSVPPQPYPILDASFLFGNTQSIFTPTINTTVQVPGNNLNFISWINAWAVSGIKIKGYLELPIIYSIAPTDPQTIDRVNPSLVPSQQTAQPRQGRIECSASENQILSKKLQYSLASGKPNDETQITQRQYDVASQGVKNLTKLASRGAQSQYILIQSQTTRTATPKTFNFSLKPQSSQPFIDSIQKLEIQSSLQQLTQDQLQIISKVNNQGYRVSQKNVFTSRCIQCPSQLKFIRSKQACVSREATFPQLYPRIFRYLLLRPYLLYLQTVNPDMNQFAPPTLNVVVPGASPANPGN